MKNYYLLFLLSLLSIKGLAQGGNNAANMDAFCAGGSTLTFPSNVGTSITPSDAANFGCLGSQPNPAWFYMQVGQSGNLSFLLNQVNTSGTGIDVDFIAWGPFNGPPPIYGSANLNSQSQVDCSYSAAATEQIDIPNAQAGQFYVVLITNFNGSAGQISLTQTNLGQPGAGSTSCAILCPITVGEDFILCPDTTATLNVVVDPQGTYNSTLTTYQWYGPSGLIPGAVTPSLTISTPGTYSINVYNPACGSAMLTDSVTVSGPGDFPTSDPEDITICYTTTPIFNLTQNDPIIHNTQDPDLWPTTYFANEANAIANFPSITNPGAYQGTDGQVVWVSIEDYNTGCKIRRPFTLHANPAPQPGTPGNFYACDIDHNGTETFDLTANDGAVLNGLDPNQFVITYHTTSAAAIGNTGAIANPENYTTGSTTIFVRITNIDDVDCYSTTSFTIEVNDQPEVTAPADAFICSTDSYILPALTQGNYYSQAGGIGPIIPVGTAITGTQTIYVYAVTGTAPNICEDEDSFTITVIPQPVAPVMPNVQECQSYTLEPLSGANYYTGPNGTGIQLFPGDVLTIDRTIYIRAQASAGGVTCSDQSSFLVDIVYPPVLLQPVAIETCDDISNDQIEIFNLIAAGNSTVSNPGDYTITYYTTNAAAQIGATSGATYIANPAARTSGNATVYIRVVAANDPTNCYAVKPLQLIVHPHPIVPQLSDYILCDDTAPAQDGVEVFDLTTKNGEATIDPTDTVTYYQSNADAQLGQNAIASPATYQNTTSPWEQTIWVRVETQFGCADTGSFQLIVNPLPLANLSTPVFYACEETPGEGLFDLDEVDPVITGGQPYLTAYYASLADIPNGITLGTPYSSPTATIYAVVTDAVTGCDIIAPVSLIVAPAPIAPEPDPIEVCDDNNDEIATFNLQPTMDAIVAALGGTVSTTIHETFDDANYQLGTNPIPNTTSYTNVQALTVGGIQTLYIRVSSTQTECFDVVAVQLIVHPRPEATDPLEAFNMCDNGDVDTDGIAIFDLTSYQDTVLNTMDAAQYTVNYYQTQDDALNGGPAITSPATYASATGSVWLTVSNNATDCFDVVELELIVNPLPVANPPAPYTLCDEVTLNDEFEEFDLTSVIPAITDGVPGVAVSFYHTYNDAVAGINFITNPEAYTNSVPAVEPIYVKVEDNETGCYRIVLLDIRVEPLPQLTPPTVDDLTVCDTNGQGYGTFDLDELVAGMVNNGVNLTVAFYLTQQDALDGLNAITNTGSYQNEMAYNQTLYVVATNTVTGCTSEVLAINLVVAPAPLSVSLEDLTQCDDQDNNGQDGYMLFDLTAQNAEIEAQLGAAPGSLTIQYFTDPDYANDGMPRITVPQSYNGQDGQEIWVRVENTTTECYQVTSFVLHISQPLLLADPTVLTLCNEALPNDHATVFDLTVKNDEILTPFGIGSGNVVEYFEADPTIAGAVAIADPTAYTNTSNPQTLYVRVTTPQGCLSYTLLTIRVTPLPTPNINPDPLELCDDTTPGDGFEVFDLTDADADVRDHQAGAVLQYYTTEAAAWAGDTTVPEYIATPQTYTNTTPWAQSVWVRVTLTGSEPGDPACAQVVELPLIVNPLPPVTNALGAIDYYAICEPGSTGYTQFNLMGHITDILTANGVNPTDYTIRFYLNAAAEAAGTALPHVYTNTVMTHQQILVYVKNNETECELTLPLDLYAEEAAIAYPITVNATITECDYDGANDGTVSYFDLTPAGTEALGTQSPTGFSVEYYTTEAAAEAGDTTAPEYIATPTAYTNVSNPQTIWVRITNLTTVSGCHDVTSFNIAVEILAEPVISTDGDDHTICVDFDGTTERSLRLETGLSETDYTFTWFLDGVDVTTADNTQSYFIAEEPGDYTVIATSTTPSLCASQPSAAFNVIQSGQASIIGDTGYVVSNAFGDNQTVTVLVEGYGEYQYTIVPEGNEPVGPWQNSNVFTNVPGGYFDIYVRDIKTDNPCDMLPITGVSVIDYPRYFTPNADGINDYWNVTGMEGHPEARIYIFDRYGKLLKQLSPASRADQGNGWDGTFNGTPLPSDDYWFRVEFTEGGTERVFKAHFAMKR